MWEYPPLPGHTLGLLAEYLEKNPSGENTVDIILERLNSALSGQNVGVNLNRAFFAAKDIQLCQNLEEFCSLIGADYAEVTNSIRNANISEEDPNMLQKEDDLSYYDFNQDFKR